METQDNLNPDQDRIAARARERWEREGKPPGRDTELWLAAEADLRTERRRPESSVSASFEQPNSPSDFPASPLGNRRARAARVGGGGRRPRPATPPRTDHFVVIADHAHLRIYHVMTAEGVPAQFELAESCDFPSPIVPKGGAAGSSPMKGKKAAGPGERPPAILEKQRETPAGDLDEERRLASELAAQIDRFFEDHAEATWDFAAGPSLHQVVLNRLGLDTRRRLGRTVVKELAQQTPRQLREHFAIAAI